MSLYIICDVQDLLNLNLKEEETVEERSVIVDEAVLDIAMALVEQEETVIEDPKSAEESAIIVS